MSAPITASAMSSIPNWEAAPQSQDRRQLASAIATVDQSGVWPGRSLRIHFDQTTQSLTVQVVNSQSDEVVDQIPSEEVLQMALMLGSSKALKDEIDGVA
jgi:uncharacterized FlaG/YvyC family protein